MSDPDPRPPRRAGFAPPRAALALVVALGLGVAHGQDTSAGLPPVLGQSAGVEDPLPGDPSPRRNVSTEVAPRDTPLIVNGLDLTALAAAYDRLLSGGRLPGAPPRASVTPGDPGPGFTGKPGPGSGAATHTVVRGDTLWEIAARYCGSGERWREIFQANRDRIRDPHWIYPGQVFRIPCGGGAPRTPGGRPPPGGRRDGLGPGSRVGDAFRPGPPGRPTTNRIQGPGARFMTHLPIPEGSWRVTDRFGARRSYGGHRGIDLAASRGTPIQAVGPGTVRQAEWISGYGWCVIIDHPGGYQTRYAHMMSRPSVRAGQQVTGGTRLGGVNSTGQSTGNHLHFEVRRRGDPVDPESCCRF